MAPLEPRLAALRDDLAAQAAAQLRSADELLDALQVSARQELGFQATSTPLKLSYRSDAHIVLRRPRSMLCTRMTWQAAECHRPPASSPNFHVSGNGVVCMMVC